MIRAFRAGGKRERASGHLWIEAVERRMLMAAVGSDGGALPALSPVSPSTPDLTAASNSGSSNTDDVTNVITPTFTGPAAGAATVQILSGGGEVGSSAVSGGTYLVTVSVSSEGAHVITARAVDSKGGVSPVSAGLNVTIDTIAPAGPSTRILTSAATMG